MVITRHSHPKQQGETDRVIIVNKDQSPAYDLITHIMPVTIHSVEYFTGRV